MLAVVPYDPVWPRRFDTERRALERVLAPWLEGGVHHVGSTAVPGLAAKPIIDIVAGVRGFEEARAAAAPLLELLYEPDPHRPGIAHHFARRGPAGRFGYGLHLTRPGSDLWRERLVFRDALRADRERAAGYATLKLELARRHGDDLASYTASKRAFVVLVLAEQGLRPGRR